jgi:hypothetical protein
MTGPFTIAAAITTTTIIIIIIIIISMWNYKQR